MRLNELFSGIPRLKGKKVLGRGIGCGKGKTSGRGHKGQKARSGCSIKGFEGGQQSILTRLPKRGFRPMPSVRYEILNLGVIQRLIDEGKINDISNVSKDLLVECGVLSSAKSKIKILGDGELRVKVGLHYDAVSKSASDKVFLPEC